MTKRINTDAPRGEIMDMSDIVDSMDPAPPFEVAYPARHPNQREFRERDPYSWIERDEEGDPV